MASFFTLGGNITPLVVPQISPVAFRRRAEAAGSVGYYGFGFSKDDLKHVLNDHSLEEVRTILDANGLIYREIELLHGWFSRGEKRQQAEGQRRFILESAGRLQNTMVKIVGIGEKCSIDQMIEGFGELCDDAATVGASVALEFLPHTRVPDLATAVAIADGASKPNGGVLIDVWHATRTGAELKAIAALPGKLISHVELTDGPLAPWPDYLQDAISRRMPCGEGAFDIAGFLKAVSATGYDGLYGVEILSDVIRSMPTEEAARLTFETTMAQFECAE